VNQMMVTRKSSRSTIIKPIVVFRYPFGVTSMVCETNLEIDSIDEEGDEESEENDSTDASSSNGIW